MLGSLSSVVYDGAMTNDLPSTARSLPIALIRAREGVMAPIREMLSESGITEQQWRVLRVLAEYGPLDASTLADRASLLVPSLTRIVQSMRQRGLVSQAQHATDRRRQVIALTPAGQQIIDDHSPAAAGIAERYRQMLGTEDYERLLDLLARLDPAREG